MYRNKSYDKDLSVKLQDREFAQGFFLTLMEGDEGLSLEDALRTTIQRMGVKEFCEKTDTRIQNINDFLKKRRKLKPDTLDAFLKPLGLKLKWSVERAS
jgi:DNA-binding phage protein